MVKKLKFEEKKPDKGLRLDLGCGDCSKTPEGFIGVDLHEGKGVRVHDLRKRWPWAEGSVDEARADYLIHYLTAPERVFFFNELFRVLKPGATAVIIVPHWCAARAYGDIRVQFPPVSEMFFSTLNKGWRAEQTSKDTFGFSCDFGVVSLVYGMSPEVSARVEEYRRHACSNFKEAVQDIHVTLVKPAKE